MDYKDIEKNRKERLIKDEKSIEKKEKRKEKSQNDNDYISPDFYDRDRILFSRSFRRLAGKTQVLTVSGKTSDHLRSRLTHSLEVVQIASSIGNYLRQTIKGNQKYNLNFEGYQEPDINLIEAIALGHDIGHTPYGHVGERALCDFFKKDLNLKSLPKKKLKHSFQSLKVCCFLEKQYYPDHYGLNLTMATLDGIFKHSMIDEKERYFYKKCFESYFQVFTEDLGYDKINEDTYDVMKKLFEYYSPITLEGAVVSIADEIAQLSHDIEDMRRLTNLTEMLPFYEDVYSYFSEYLFTLGYNSNIKPELNRILIDFSNTLSSAKKDTAKYEMKLERVYTKLILELSIKTIGKFMINLWKEGENDRLKYLKNCYTGSFNELTNFCNKLPVDLDTQEGLKCLKKTFDRYNTIPKNIKEIARWDIKGEEMCKDLVNILYDSVSKTNGSDYNSNIFDKELREHLKKSHRAGLIFGEKMECKNTDEIAKKCLIWDYIAGMTDSYIIEEYESFSFKKIELH